MDADQEEWTASTSVSTVRTLHAHMDQPQSVPIASIPNSPLQLPSSCPTSPSGSISSLPSVGSSYFFSSAAASPPHPPYNPHPHEHPGADHALAHEQAGVHGLIIPELMLPTALRRPTAYGQTLGDLRLIVVGDGAAEVARALLDDADNEDLVEVGAWEAWDGEGEGGEVLRASTDWIEHRDAHGLEKFEAARNVEVVAFSSSSKETLEASILAPFDPLLAALNPAEVASGVMSNLLQSPYTPLYTALIHLPSTLPTRTETQLLSTLAPLIPIISLPLAALPSSPSPSGSANPQRAQLSAFAPRTLTALRTGLFHTPETLTLLRGEAADRFLRWREAQRLVPTLRPTKQAPRAWSKRQWECEWEHLLSADVARARAKTVTQDSVRELGLGARSRRRAAHSHDHDTDAHERDGAAPCYDPLHLPSFVSLALALLRPARAWAGVVLMGMGGFCVGVGVGAWLVMGARAGSAGAFGGAF